MRDGRINFRAGAGIVADSDAMSELDETRAKARGLLRALSPEASHLIKRYTSKRSVCADIR